MTKIGIVCAMSEEVDKIVTAFNLQKINTDLGYKIYQNQQITLIESSIGKVASTLAASVLVNHESIDRLINIGLAGALKNTPVGSAYFVSSVTQHDAFIPFEEYQPDMYQDINCVVPAHVKNTATLATGDQFIDNIEQIDSDADLVDMEGFAVAYVAKKHHLPIMIIKGVSDDANSSSEAQLFKNLTIAMDQTIALLKQVI
jgi:nucleoside phosphorylase